MGRQLVAGGCQWMSMTAMWTCWPRRRGCCCAVSEHAHMLAAVVVVSVVVVAAAVVAPHEAEGFTRMWFRRLAAVAVTVRLL